MYRFLTVIIALLMFVTDYGSLGFVAAALVLAVYIMLINVFHNLAEAAEKKRKKKKSLRNGHSTSSV